MGDTVLPEHQLIYSNTNKTERRHCGQPCWSGWGKFTAGTAVTGSISGGRKNC